MLQPTIPTTQALNTATATNALILTAMYQVAFDRLPDVDGFTYWMNDLANGHTIHDVARSFGTHIPQFAQNTVDNTINFFFNNAVGHDASANTLNHWEILAINAVPSYALMEQLSLQLVGQPTEAWAGSLV